MMCSCENRNQPRISTFSFFGRALSTSRSAAGAHIQVTHRRANRIERPQVDGRAPSIPAAFVFVRPVNAIEQSNSGAAALETEVDPPPVIETGDRYNC
jgi:hypothetical protein